MAWRSRQFSTGRKRALIALRRGRATLLDSLSSHAATSPAPPRAVARGAPSRAAEAAATRGSVVLAELGGMAMGLVDVMMVGRVGATAIGAVSVGANLFHFVSMFGIGILLGLDILVSHAFGAGRMHEAHRTSCRACTVRVPRGSLGPCSGRRSTGCTSRASIRGAARRARVSLDRQLRLLPFLWFVVPRRYPQAVGLVRAATFAPGSARTRSTCS